MEIKNSRTQSMFLTRLRSFSRIPGLIRWLIMVVLGITCLSVMLLASIRYGMELHKNGEAGNTKEIIDHLKQTKLRIIPNFFRGLTARPPLLKIDMSFKNLQSLAFDRANAIEQQIMLSDSTSLVPAAITYGEKTYQARLRLKGDWTSDNLCGDKWSFRVTLRGDNTLFGMKQFSLHHPRVRNYIYEWLFHKMLDKEGVIPLRYLFVRLSLNGKDLGVYALEEHFEKRLIENSRRREGPILKFDETERWVAVRNFWPQVSHLGFSSMYSAGIDAFKSGTLLADSALYQQFLLACGLLEKFRTGELSPHEVFDTQKMAAYFAVVDLIGSQHALSWHNLRFYFNPITSRLEPIGFDGDSGARTDYLCGMRRGLGIETNPFMDLILGDQVIFREYVATLERMADPEYLRAFLEDVGEELEKNLDIIYSEFQRFSYSADVLYRNQNTIRQSLVQIKGIHVYTLAENANRITLQAGNIQAWPIEIKALQLPDGRQVASPADLILEPHDPSLPVTYQSIAFDLPGNYQNNDSLAAPMKVLYAIPGADSVWSVDVFPWPLVNESLLSADPLRQAPNVKDFPWMQVDNTNGTIIIRPGTWTITKNMMIPSGYKVLCSGETILSLERGARIISYSPLFFKGSRDNKIIIRSDDTAGQGLVVLKADARSLIDYAVFENLSNPAQGGWSLTGAVTFYESDVSFTNCLFQGNRCEDFVNFVRTDVSMDNCLFKNASADAFDGDFCTGHVTNVAFSKVGNDAFDVSGSVIDMNGISITGAGDKGISIGENSRVTAGEVDINNAEIGIAAKDLSTMEITGLNLNNTRVGFALYQKKPEFGQAIGRISNLVSANIEVMYLIEKGSELTVNGRSVESRCDNVESLLYGSVYGKSSK